MMKYRPVVAVALVFALASAPVASYAAAPAQPRPKVVAQPLVTLTDLVINSVNVVHGQLVANATATLKVLNRTVTQTLQIPLRLGGSPGAAGECDILNLTLGPINLDLLGLIVNLDDCNGGPITVDITGDMGPGNLLGNLVCSIAGLLDGGLDLGGILGGLTRTQLNTLLGGLTGILNGVLDRFFATAVPMPMALQEVGDCPILDLMVGPINLNLLGLVVETSQICLNISSQSGPGNLLGNLLCSLTGLLDNGANLGSQIALAQSIINLINRLGL